MHSPKNKEREWQFLADSRGGATALIAVTGGEGIHQLGYLYAFVPCLLGALIMLAIALIVNNIPKAQRYPQFWW